MFESHSQKGLFTFYWEQSHPRQNPKTPEQTENLLLKRKKENLMKFQMKEKKNVVKQVINQSPDKKEEKIMYKYSLPQKASFTEKDKYVSICTVQFTDKLVHHSPESSVLRTNKENDTLHKKKKSCQLPKLRKLTSLKKEDKQQNSIINQLIQQEQKHTPSMLQLQLREYAKGNEKKQKTHRLKKQQRCSKTMINSPSNAGKQTDRLTHVQQKFKLESRGASNRLPTVTIHPKRPKRVSKEPFFIEKISFEQQTLAHSRSVVCLGLTNIDNYADRYQKRKEQFLRQLQVNMLNKSSQS